MNRFKGRDLACVRGGRLVFAGLGFALEEGDVLLLTGRNGSGKSTLLRLAAGLCRPAGGMLAWHDGPVADDPARHRLRVQYVGHLDAVKPALSVAENLAVWARLRGARTDGVAEALDSFGLDPLAAMPARYLSAGQRRRLALARLRASPARLWLLDEPTVALDRESIAALHDALARYRDGGGMAIIATNVDLAISGATTLALGDFAPAADSDAEGLVP